MSFLSTYTGGSFIPGLVVLVVLYGLNALRKVGSRQESLPPGPPTKLVIGNIDIFPTGHVHLQFAEWAKTYGDVFSLKLLNKTMIILSSPSGVREIIDKRSLSSSNRPKSIIADKIIPNNLNLGSGRFANDTWKVLRKPTSQLLSGDNFSKFRKYQAAEATQLMWDLTQSSEDWYEHIHRFTTSFAMGIVYGKRSPRIQSPDIVDFQSAHHQFLHALNIGSLPPVDLFPILDWIPERFAQWKQTATEARLSHEMLYNRLLYTVRKRLEDGRGNGCFIEDIINNSDTWGLTSDELIMNLGGVIIQGSDTSSATLQNVVLCLVVFPDAQAKAREEIDRVVGHDRAPTWEDLEKLPYTLALIEEANRYRPVGPLGLPHEMTEDEIVDGFLYPKESVIFMNIYAIFHDERYFERPDEFIPERFLKNPSGVKNDVVDDPGRRPNLAFGGGRRVCPGIVFAKSSMEMNVVNFIWAFNFLPALDPSTGTAMIPDLNDYSTGVTATPKATRIRIQSRSEKHKAIIAEQFAASADVCSQYEQELSEEDAQYLQKVRNPLYY